MKLVRKVILIALTSLSLAGSLTNCAKVFGGRVTEAQKPKPMPGEPKHRVRAGALIAAIMLFPLLSIPVNFATGAIYKPRSPSVRAHRRLN